MTSQLPAWMVSRKDRSPLRTPVGRRLLQCGSARELSPADRKHFYDTVAPVGLDPGATDKFWTYVVMGPDRLLGFTEAVKCLAHSMGDAEPALFVSACHELVRSFAELSEPCADGYVCEGSDSVSGQ